MSREMTPVDSLDAPTMGMSSDIATPRDHAYPFWIGEFEVLGEIARGATGVVYRARQQSLQREVAIKVLHDDVTRDASVKSLRIQHEAQAAGCLDHPGIVPIYEVGQHQGQAYFVMAFVDGPSLAQSLAFGPWSARRSAELIAAVAEAIAFAHRRQVVHLDLKPANILIDPSGRPRITDFGIARRHGLETNLTEGGVGTPQYMSPEQASGDPQALGPACDIYGIGAVLFTLLTGRPPFQGSTVAEILVHVMEQEPLSPRWLVPSVPAELEAITLQLLAKKPSQRYNSADEVAHDLQRFLRGEPVRARSPHGWNWLVRKYRQHLVLASLSSFGALLLVGLVLTLTIAFAHANWRVTELEMEKLELLQTLDTERALARRALLNNSRSTQPAVDVTRWIEHAVSELPRNPKLSALLAAETIRLAKACPNDLEPILKATIQQSSEQAPDVLISALVAFAQRELTDSEKSRYGITMDSTPQKESIAPEHQPSSAKRALQR